MYSFCNMSISLIIFLLSINDGYVIRKTYHPFLGVVAGILHNGNIRIIAVIDLSPPIEVLFIVGYLKKGVDLKITLDLSNQLIFLIAISLI